MGTLLWSSVASLLIASALPAQTRTIAERLGHPADSKRLIIHAHDLGTAHSVNAASFDALEKGAGMLRSSESTAAPASFLASFAFPLLTVLVVPAVGGLGGYAGSRVVKR